MSAIGNRYFVIIYHPADEDGFLICHQTGLDHWTLPSGKFPEPDGKIPLGAAEKIFLSKYFKSLTDIGTDRARYRNVARLDRDEADGQTLVFFYDDHRREDPYDYDDFHPQNPRCLLTAADSKDKQSVCDSFKYILFDEAEEYLDANSLHLLKLAFECKGGRDCILKKFKDLMLRARLERVKDIKPAALSADEEAMFEAVKDSGKLQTLFDLVRKGVDANARDKDGYTALYRCADPGKTRLLLKAGADPNIICRDQGLFESPLHKAVKARNPELVEVLVEGGADLFYHDHRNMTSVDTVGEMEGDEIKAHSLLYYNNACQSGMKDNDALNKKLAKIANKIGWLSYYDEVTALLKAGANPYARINGKPSVMEVIDDAHRKTMKIIEYFQRITDDVDLSIFL